VAVAPLRTIAPAVVQFADRTRRHIGVRVLPFLFALYIVNYIDRTNLAYAALGMSRDLGFSDRVLGLGAGIFFISYVALQIPGALLVERWSARRMISASMIAWGMLTALTALVHTPGQLYAARFVIGAAEAGFFPGVIVYLSHWFLREDRAKATSNFMAAVPLSSVLGSPLAGWILGHAWLGVTGWRWLFVVEGLPAIVLGGVAFFFLTDWPREATWLAAEQRRWIQQRLQEESPVCAKAITVWQALRSRTILVMALLTFFNYFATYSFIFWFPTLLKRQSGFSDLRVGLVGAIPFVATFIAMQVNGWHSDKTLERRWHSAVPQFVAAGALIVLLTQPRSIPLWVALFTLVGMAISYLPIFWAIPTEILSQSAAATAVGMINSVGSIAGFAGPYAFGYLYARTHSVSFGLALMMMTALAGGLLILRIPSERDAAMDSAMASGTWDPVPESPDVEAKPEF
jgi:MFS transporter, ACS family, tartrate transporter